MNHLISDRLIIETSSGVRSIPTDADVVFSTGSTTFANCSTIFKKGRPVSTQGLKHANEGPQITCTDLRNRRIR